MRRSRAKDANAPAASRLELCSLAGTASRCIGAAHENRQRSADKKGRSIDAPARDPPHPYGGGAAIDGRQPVRVCGPRPRKLQALFPEIVLLEKYLSAAGVTRALRSGGGSARLAYTSV